MTERKEDIIVDGRVVGWRVVVDGVSESEPAFIEYKDFIDAWTIDELDRYYTAKRDYPVLEGFEALLKAIGGVRVGSEKAEAGKAALVQLGVLTQERADALFSA